MVSHSIFGTSLFYSLMKIAGRIEPVAGSVLRIPLAYNRR
jgi:hypothetical protein